MFGVPEVVHSRGGLCMSLLQGIEVIVVGHGWRLANRGERYTCDVVLMGVPSLSTLKIDDLGLINGYERITLGILQPELEDRVSTMADMKSYVRHD